TAGIATYHLFSRTGAAPLVVLTGSFRSAVWRAFTCSSSASRSFKCSIAAASFFGASSSFYPPGLRGRRGGAADGESVRRRTFAHDLRPPGRPSQSAGGNREPTRPALIDRSIGH